MPNLVVELFLNGILIGKVFVMVLEITICRVYP